MATNYAEKFTTSEIMGGIRIEVDQTNPISSKGTVPTAVTLKLFEWNTNYSTTVAGTSLVTDKAVISSEEIESNYMWIFLFFTPLPIGTYLWLLTVDYGDETGVFQVRYNSGSSYNNAFEDGVSKSYDFHSEIMGIDPETYECVMSIGDIFDGGHQTTTGHSDIKINRNTIISPNYVNAVKSQDTVTNGSKKIGRIASGSQVKSN